MKDLCKGILTASLLIALLYPALGEVQKLSVSTDKSWKSLDIAPPGWTSQNYDDSWWNTASEISSDSVINEGLPIWHPGTTPPSTAYFRRDFEINGDVKGGQVYAGTSDCSSKSAIEVYVNEQYVGKFKECSYAGKWHGCSWQPAEINITSYLVPGMNAIAVKVATDPDREAYYRNWALSGTIWYGT